MNPKNNILLLLVTLFLAITVSPQPARTQDQRADVIKFAIFPYKSPRILIKIFAPIAQRIEEKTGQKVRLVSAPDYASFIERGKQGQYDLVFPCVTCFYRIQSAGYHVIARGEPSFHGGVIVRNDSVLTTLEQLKGKKIAAIGRHSYAGYLFLKEQLTEKGISPDTDSEFHFLKTNDSIIFGVINKRYDAGVIRIDSLKMPELDSILDKIKILFLSPDIPQFPFAVKDEMDPAIEKIIQRLLLNMNPENEEDKIILDDLRIQEIVPADNSDYDDFRLIIGKHINLNKE